MPTFLPDELRRFVKNLLTSSGVSPEEALIVSDSLVESNLLGHDSHGLFRVLEYTDQISRGDLVPGAKFTISHENEAILSADGNLGFGQIQCRRLIDLVSRKAQRLGIACGTLRRSGHVGRLGEWVEIAARAGFAAFLSVNDNGVLRYVAPPGGLEPRISTNPFAIGVPTARDPLVLDMSTSAVARGKIRVAMLAGQPVPIGWIQDARGNPTTDPHAITTTPPGTLLPLGGDQGFKGFGLGMMIDILSAGLAGGSCPPATPGTPETNNVLLVIWNPDLFFGREHFLKETEKLINSIRETPLKPGVDCIRLPGDGGRQTRKIRSETGISLLGENWTKLVELASQRHVTLPKPL